MKRKIAVILAIIMMSGQGGWAEDITLNPEVKVPEIIAAPIVVDATKSISGIPKGYEDAVATRFSDISKTPYKNDILRVAMEGIIKGAGGGPYRPDAAITKQEALAFMVRLRGLEGTVQQRMAAAAPDPSLSYTARLFQEYVNQAQLSGILTAAENQNVDKSATREEVSVWLARTLNLQTVLADQSALNVLSDNQSIQVSNRGLLEALLNEKIITGDVGGKFNPSRTVSRGEMAQMLNRSLPKQYQAQGVTVNYGIVSGAKTETSYAGGTSITDTILTVKNMDGTTTQLKASYTAKTKARLDFPVLKNGLVGTASMLSSGDQVEYLTKNNQVQLVQVYTDGSVLRRLKEDSLKNQTVRTYYGTAVSKISETRQVEGKTYYTDRIRIKNQTGQTFDLVVDTDATTNVKNDVVVTKNGMIGGSGLIQTGDFLEYAVRDPNIAMYFNATPAQVSTIKGTIRSVDISSTTSASYLTVLDYNNSILKYPVAGYADISVNSEYAKLQDLKLGQNVSVTINNGLITGIQAETFVNPGYITPESKMRMGTIQSIQSSGMAISTNDGLSLFITASPNTIIRKNGQLIPITTLRLGDSVKLYFSSVNSSTPDKIEVEGSQQLITGVYKGKIAKVGTSKNEIFLREPQYLKNNQWTASSDYLKPIELAATAKIYYNGQPISLDKIKSSLIEADAYVAIKDSYSKDIGVQMLVKSGGERLHYDSVYTVNQAAEKFELGNRINYTFNDGTMVIRDNRLISTANITDKDSALVISNYNKGTYTAGIVSLDASSSSTDTNTFFKNVYIGTIRKIYSSQFQLEKTSKLENLTFDDMYAGRVLEFGYGEDTLISDVTSTSVQTVSNYNFFNGGYSTSENPRKTGKGMDFYSWYTIAVTDDNMDVISMMIRKGALLEDQDIDSTYNNSSDQNKAIQKVIDQIVLTRGTVTAIDSTNSRLTLSDSMDYSELQKQWIRNRVNTYVTLGDVIIMKNNKVKTLDDIQQGDRLDIVRAKANALVIFIED